MILDPQSIGSAIDEITESESLNANDADKLSTLERQFKEDNEYDVQKLSQRDDLMKPWETSYFKRLLFNYIKTKYDKELSVIPDSFAEKVYVKAYNEHIAPVNSSNRFSLPIKITYHPYVTKDDYKFVNENLRRGQSFELYSSLGAVSLISLGLYVTPFGRRVKNNPKMFAVVVGIPPIMTLLLSKVFFEYYIDRKLTRIGMGKKYGLEG